MSLPKPLSLAIAAITLVAAAATDAQDLTATLRVNGEVMVSTGGEFRTAIDGQPILPGHRIMVGQSASATVQFSQDCQRTYNSAGVYTVTPAMCKDDKGREEQEQQATDQGTEVARSASSTLTTVGVVVGTVVGIGALFEQADDEPLSR